ncbi:MAG: DUF1554 domain-containing protein, partial [Leptospiraceae bacterium]|nr:DUF1554 domain-containing protein [Leptospiraceae bacterium]
MKYQSFKILNYIFSLKKVLIIIFSLVISNCSLSENKFELLGLLALEKTSPPSDLVFTGSPYSYTQNVSITTNTPTFTGSVTSCISSPDLPTGLSINTTTCAISGTPTITQSATTYTITAGNSGGNTTTTIEITISSDQTVTGTPPSNLTYSGSPYTYVQNSAITTNTPTFTGTITACSSSPSLPTGLSIDATTCAISGTPTATQSATSHTITASNSVGSTTASINITVSGVAPSGLTYSGSPYTYIKDATITTTTPTVTGSITGCSSSPTLPTGLSLDSTTCAISGTPTVTQSATTHTITASNGVGSTTASIVITVNLFYSASTFAFKQNSAIPTISPTGGGTITACSSSPTLPTGLSLSTGCVITGTPTSTSGATTYTITPTMTGGPANVSISIKVLSTVYRVFVTNSSFTGDLKTNGAAGDGAAGADNLCNADSNKPSSGTYKAIIFDNSNRTANPTLNNWVLYASQTYVRSSDYAIVFTSNASSIFSFGTLTNSFDSGVQKEYWTGFRGSGFEWEYGLYRCSDWTDGTSSQTGRFGQSDN